MSMFTVYEKDITLYRTACSNTLAVIVTISVILLNFLSFFNRD